MSFSLISILWTFALLAAALAAFGAFGVPIAVVVILFWVRVHFRGLFTAFEFLIILAIIAVLVGLLLPAVQASCSVARQSWCRNNMATIAKALTIDASRTGAFPPSDAPIKRGTPPCSWRVKLLPTLDMSALRDSYYVHYNEPWDGANHVAIAQTRVDLYQCPSDPPVSLTHPTTNYFAVVDAQTMWPPDHGRALNEVADDPAYTILLIEVAGRDTPWSKPEDLSFDEAVAYLTNMRPLQSVVHFDVGGANYFQKRDTALGTHIAFADGSVRFVPLPLPKDLAVPLLTVAGNEPIDKQAFDRLTLPQTDYAKIYAHAAFVLLALAPAARLFRKRRPSLAA